MFNLKEYTMKMKSIFNKKILIAIATISSLYNRQNEMRAV